MPENDVFSAKPKLNCLKMKCYECVAKCKDNNHKHIQKI
jgi:hypothetical protein